MAEDEYELLRAILLVDAPLSMELRGFWLETGRSSVHSRTRISGMGFVELVVKVASMYAILLMRGEKMFIDVCGLVGRVLIAGLYFFGFDIHLLLILFVTIEMKKVFIALLPLVLSLGLVIWKILEICWSLTYFVTLD
jgi:hypothetical protein